MMADFINGCFEMVGAYLTWKNYRQVVADKGHAGIYWPSVVFFTSWGVWNLFYYPSLNQAWSFLGGIALVTANCCWLWAMWRYGKKA